MANTKKTNNTKVIQLIINKKVDMDDFIMNDSYDEYFEYVSSYVDAGIMDPKNVLTEEEYDLIKEAVEKYGK